jgi:hypothetical protein
MRSDGKLVVDVHALLSSDKVQRDLDVMRRKISEADVRRGKDRSSADPDSDLR